MLVSIPTKPSEMVRLFVRCSQAIEDIAHLNMRIWLSVSHTEIECSCAGAVIYKHFDYKKSVSHPRNKSEFSDKAKSMLYDIDALRGGIFGNTSFSDSLSRPQRTHYNGIIQTSPGWNNRELIAPWNVYLEGARYLELLGQ